MIISVCIVWHRQAGVGIWLGPGSPIAKEQLAWQCCGFFLRFSHLNKPSRSHSTTLKSSAFRWSPRWSINHVSKFEFGQILWSEICYFGSKNSILFFLRAFSPKFLSSLNCFDLDNIFYATSFCGPLS